MKQYFQYLIYDQEQYNEMAGENGVMFATSNLYIDESACRQEAQKRIDELDKEFETTGKFHYETQSVVVVSSIIRIGKEKNNL